MQTRNSVYSVLGLVTLLALLLSSTPVMAGPAPSIAEGSGAEGPAQLVDAPVPPGGDNRTSGDGVADDQAYVSEALHDAPLMFVENAGQFDHRARFQVHGADRTLWLAEDALWVTLLEPGTQVEQADILNPSVQDPRSEIENRQAAHLKLSFAGANPHPRLEPFDRLDTHVSYFIGGDPAGWRADVPVWGGVRYVDLDPGLDLEITGGDTWSWRMVARAPEVDLGAVRLRVDGADELALDGTVDSAGRQSVRVSTALGAFALPLLEPWRRFGDSFQAGSDSAHRELWPYEGHSQPSPGLAPTVTGSEVVAPFAGETLANSSADAPTRALDIPGDLLYATFLGGSETDRGYSIAVDGSGNAYVTGYTESSDFPAVGGPGYDTSYNGYDDAFVVKLAMQGTPPPVSPTTLDFGATLTELTLSINPENPTGDWTLSESVPWLSLSRTGGTGPATVTASVDRSGLSEGTYNGTINATVGGQAVTVNVTMRVVAPQVTIITPPPGSTVYHSDSLLVKAAVTLDGQPLPGAQVAGGTALPQYGAAPFSLHDDGDHEDGAADDGIYAGRIALYGPLTMPTSGNPYLLTVTATTDSGTASDSVSINLAASDGAPTVAVEVSGPSAPDYFVGQQATVTATLTYPDYSIHTDTALTLTVTEPDLDVVRVGLTNVAANAWRGTYTFPVGHGGRYYLDARADPPASTHFVDGWATATPAPYVYQGALRLALKTASGPWPLHSQVPLSVCVTSGTQAISDATVDARFTAPVAGDGGQLDEVGTTGCYRRDYAAQTPGTHTVVIQAQRPAYKTGTVTGTFQVSDQPAVLSDTIQTFETWTIWDMEHGLAHVIQAADDGDYFKEEMKADEFKLVVQGFVDLLGVASAATAPVQAPWTIEFPGWKEALPEMADLVSDEVVAALVAEGITEAERRRVNAAAMTYFATGGNLSRTLPGSDTLEAVTKEYYVIIPLGESLADNFAQVLSNTVGVNRAGFIARVDETLANLPTLTEPEQAAYVTDLIARQDANEWLAVRDLRYQTNFLNAVRNKREEDEHNYVKMVVVFVSETAVKGVAFCFADGPGLAAANAAALAWHAYLNSEAVKEDQRMRDLALAIAHAGYRSESILYTNSMSALSLISQQTPPPTPDGAMLSVDLHRTTDWLGFTRDVYADVRIENTGPIPAHFGVKAYFEKPDETLRMVEGLTNPATGETMPVVELAPHDVQTLRMYLKKDGEYDHGVPRKGEPIRFNLYAYTDYGAWLVHGMPEVEYRPTAARRGTSPQYARWHGGRRPDRVARGHPTAGAGRAEIRFRLRRLWGHGYAACRQYELLRRGQFYHGDADGAALVVPDQDAAVGAGEGGPASRAGLPTGRIGDRIEPGRGREPPGKFDLARDRPHRHCGAQHHDSSLVRSGREPRLQPCLYRTGRGAVRAGGRAALRRPGNAGD